MLMAGRELACVDKFGRPLVGSVQVVPNCIIPGRSQATIHCKVNNQHISELGVVEGAHDGIELASSLNQLTTRGEILVQRVNSFTESVKLPAGFMLGRFHSVQGEEVGPSLGDTTKDPDSAHLESEGPSRHTSRSCMRQPVTSNEERQAMAKLLHEYNDVFSSGDHDRPNTSRPS